MSKKHKPNRLKKSSKPKKYMVITSSKGRIVVEDYSNQDDRHELRRLLKKAGVKTKVEFDSWCG